MTLSKSFFAVGFITLLIAFAAPQAYAKDSADDGTADQGKGDVAIQASTQLQLKNNSIDDDGTPDQGRGDVSTTGALNTAFEATLGGTDDGTTDQGSGDVRTRAEASAITEADVNADANIFVKVRTFFVSLFSWIHF